ncbi:MAG: flagellar biosynthesis regulator FlaF [Pseudomonadota bacterium]
MGYAQAANAYATLDPALTSPGRAEARVFATITRRLHAVFSDATSSAAIQAQVLHDNRRLWQAAAMQCADDDNEMPADLRAAIISLAGFVDRQTSVILRGGGSAQSLIEINTRMATGLSAEEA